MSDTLNVKMRIASSRKTWVLAQFWIYFHFFNFLLFLNYKYFLVLSFFNLYFYSAKLRVASVSVAQLVNATVHATGTGGQTTLRFSSGDVWFA